MSTLQKISLQETVGGKGITIGTGTLAKQAGGAVTIQLGDTIVFSAATCAENAKEVHFVPLTSDYRERAYAAGRVPGGFFKREMRPRDKETLTSRLVDRPIRPLFPKAGTTRRRSSPSSSAATWSTTRTSSPSPAPPRR